ncbi:cytochrome d ubiquinol oxidase subunit II [Psychrobium sp. MM17-31]|uniref:cytochrome d ubiquinol oxidase subunit II n=1 Tax=Psychrobium sp. MM17-31 TaxID=2917758 RepID=UPI001EF65A75|nr:cytochrome d ubiquinol oxidase subunit II [Psychrobium sp. MM17-31]MCG7531591.1 cytochrome d ubiquinol oxidase subunit II [Psychrobium sp. MM17-31]
MFGQEALALIFGGLMALTILLYAILDGYDLGVGMLLPLENDKQADEMIASIGPFWDANETWLVMAMGLLFIAFPLAHSMVFKALYLPTLVMLIALIIRGIAFDFRAKALFTHKPIWDRAFKYASLVASIAQGYMLGQYVVGFEQNSTAILFSLLSGIGVAMAYSLIGTAWLIMKCEGDLQVRAIRWFKIALIVAAIGVLLVSIVNPMVNSDVAKRWFNTPAYWLLPVLCVACFAIAYVEISKIRERKWQDTTNDERCWAPFLWTVAIYVLCFTGFCLSFYPEIVPGKLTIWESVAAPQALNFLLWGAMIVIPTILAYTAYSYRVFWGKVSPLQYY